MPVIRLLIVLSLALGAAPSPAAARDDSRLVVGSKRFTESYILAEIVARTAAPHAPVEHRRGLGNTAVVFEALKAGEIDVYPEYRGTLEAEILKHAAPADLATAQRELAALGLGVGVPLGFQNGYAFAMRADEARRLGITRLSDLARHPQLAFGLSHEFLGRADGWPGLAARYALPQRPTGIDHGIAYEALAAGRIAVTDIYSTDAKIAELGLLVLDDDRAYFPRYDALLLYRLDVAQRLPAAWRAVGALEGRIDAARMIAMNGDAELRGRPFAEIAAAFVAAPAGSAAAPAAAPRQGVVERLFADDLGRLAREHVVLVLVAVLAAAVVGIPLGAAAAALPRLEGPVLAVVGVLQTVPSLALFAMLIPLLGRIGTVPIVRNTATGLLQVPRGLRDAGTALGLTRWQRWRSVDLPLAAPVVLAGIKTAAVITVGTATIAAFIGAGGFGERIATGLALNDHAALLAGALPAAALALLTQGLFGVVERVAGWSAAQTRPSQ